MTAIDVRLLAQQATLLESLLMKYAPQDADAASVLSGLLPLLADAKAGRISAPVEWRLIPGTVFFTEGSLDRFKDLSEAYASFKVTLSGLRGDPRYSQLIANIPPPTP